MGKWMKAPAKEFCCMGRMTPKESCFAKGLQGEKPLLFGWGNWGTNPGWWRRREAKSHLLHTVAFERSVFLLERRLIHIAQKKSTCEVREGKSPSVPVLSEGFVCLSRAVRVKSKHNHWSQGNWEVKSILLTFCYWFLNGFSSWKQANIYSAWKGAWGRGCRWGRECGVPWRCPRLNPNLPPQRKCPMKKVQQLWQGWIRFPPSCTPSPWNISVILSFQRSKGRERKKKKKITSHLQMIL